MAVIHINILSRCLAQKTDVRVVVPTPTLDEMMAGKDRYDKEERFPVVYLLHGAAWDSFDWLSNSRIEDLAQRYRFIAVMPSCGLSFYNNVSGEERYFDYVADELPRMVEALFPASDRPEDRYVAGVSMGGYGAMRVGLTYPERYAKIGCVSGCLDVYGFLKASQGRPGIFPIFTKLGELEEIPGSQRDILHLARTAAERGGELPAIWHCMGTEEFIYAQNRPLVDALKKLPLDYTYVEGPGVHNWDFWNPMLEHGLFDFIFATFHNKILGGQISGEQN